MCFRPQKKTPKRGTSKRKRCQPCWGWMAVLNDERALNKPPHEVNKRGHLFIYFFHYSIMYSSGMYSSISSIIFPKRGFPNFLCMVSGFHAIWIHIAASAKKQMSSWLAVLVRSTKVVRLHNVQRLITWLRGCEDQIQGPGVKWCEVTQQRLELFTHV